MQFHAHAGAAGSLSFTLGDSILLNAPDDIPQARLWNTADGTLVRNIIDKAGCCLLQRIVSPDGRRIAVVEAHDVSVWDARSGHRLMRSDLPPWHQLSVAFSPDGSRLATGHERGLVRVWDVQSGKEVLTLGDHQADIVTSVAFSPDGRHILTTGCCLYAEALVWDARSGAHVASLLGHEESPQEGGGGIRSAAFSPDGRYIVTAGQDATVRLWEFTPAAPARLLGDEGNPRLFQFSPDGSLIAAIGDGAVLVWRPGQKTPVRLPSGDADRSGFAFSPDGSRLLVLSEDDEDPLYDPRTLEQVGSYSFEVVVNRLMCFHPLSFSPDGSRIVGCSGEVVDGNWRGGLVRIWDAHSGKELMVLKRHGNIQTATFVGQGDRVMTTGGGVIRFWDAADGSQLVQIRVSEESGAVVWAGASPDGTLVASGTDWKWAGVWDTHTGKLILKLAGAGENTFVDRFTPDGRYVVTRDDNSDTVGLWDPRTGKLVRALRGPEARIVTIDLSASGHRLLAGAADQTVRMWDTETGTLLFFADISALRTEDVPIPAGAAKVLVGLHPSGEQALAELIGQREPGLLFDLPDHRGIEGVVDAAYAAVPYRFTEEERAEQELDLFGRPDPRSADLEVLTQPPTD